MSERLRELAARKELLLARSRLHRLQLQYESQALRRSLARPATVLSIASSAPVRPLVFSALLALLGRGRLARVVRGAMAALAIVQAARTILHSIERKRASERHLDWLIDESIAESFPASDPSAIAQPHARP